MPVATKRHSLRKGAPDTMWGQDHLSPHRRPSHGCLTSPWFWCWSSSLDTPWGQVSIPMMYWLIRGKGKQQMRWANDKKTLSASIFSPPRSHSWCDCHWTLLSVIKGFSLCDWGICGLALQLHDWVRICFHKGEVSLADILTVQS